MNDEKILAEIAKFVHELSKLPPEKQLEFLYMLKGATMALSCKSS